MLGMTSKPHARSLDFEWVKVTRKEADVDGHYRQAKVKCKGRPWFIDALA
jgi:hypothetical protein